MRDSHPHWCSFPRGLHLCPSWWCISRLQFKAEGPDFHPELIPVHSPLLRESYLVSFPPLTYMLKFSGFADLTSCLECDRRVTKAEKDSGRRHPRWRASKSMRAWFVAENRQGDLHALNVSRAETPSGQKPERASTLTHNDTETATWTPLSLAGERVSERSEEEVGTLKQAWF
jgi:hypothetical protein